MQSAYYTDEFTMADQPAYTYIHPISTDTGYNFEDIPRAMTDRDRLSERVKGISAIITT